MQHNATIGQRYDVVIVGGRCAGAATAMLLARAGAKVLLVDRQQYGSDTVSTHALMRAGVLQLGRWGLLDRLLAAGTPLVTATTFHYGTEAIRVDIPPKYGVDGLCAPRRTILDRILVDAARDAGAETRHGVSLSDLRFDRSGRATGVYLKDAAGGERFVHCGTVVGADGRRSVVARRVGARSYVEGTGASGSVYGYYEGLPADGFHWYFHNGVAAGTIPTNGDRHCVFVSVPQEAFAATFRGGLEGGFRKAATANSPRLYDDISRARLVGRLRGFSGGAGYLRQAHGAGWALVGDAGYFKDPLTAHGISDALRDAELLARALLRDCPRALERYQEERDTLSRPLFDATDAIATFKWDLDEVRQHHVRLSNAMQRECAHVAGLSTASPLAA
jgi:flavin-dependent dehydrogenase